MDVAGRLFDAAGNLVARVGLPPLMPRLVRFAGRLFLWNAFWSHYVEAEPHEVAEANAWVPDAHMENYP